MVFGKIAFLGEASKSNLVVAFLLPVSLIAVALIYWSALDGGFLLDDYAHLPRMQVHDFSSFVEFVLSENNTPGRFLSYASFVINDNAWPSDARSFKYTNLMFHLLNGVLVFVLVRALIKCSYSDAKAEKIALVVMLLWLVHPLQITTVMYVIQRMTILSSGMILVGLIMYAYGRSRLGDKPIFSYLLMSFAIAGIGIIGIFFKETAANLLVYTVLVEIFFLSRVYPVREKIFQLWKVCSLYIPIAISLLYIISFSYLNKDGVSRNDFNTLERLLTESRVVFEYFSQIVAPNLTKITLYHDGYEISRGVLTPPITAFCILFHGFLLYVAWVVRKKWLFLSFGIFWFYGGHVLESTTLPLELYFEHRNYLPMLGILVTLVWGVFKLGERFRLAYSGLFIYAFALAILNYVNSLTWGDPALLRQVWVASNPNSPRASFDSVDFKMQSNRIADAQAEVDALKNRYPNAIVYEFLEILMITCPTGKEVYFTESQMDLMRHGRLDLRVLESISALKGKWVAGGCVGLSERQLIEAIKALASNSNFDGYKRGVAYLYYNLVDVYERNGDVNNAVRYLDKAYNSFPYYEFRLKQALILARSGRVEDAHMFLDLARKGGVPNKLAFFYRDYKVDKIEQLLASQFK